MFLSCRKHHCAAFSRCSTSPLGSTASGWSISAPLPGWEREEPLYAILSFPNIWEGPEPPSAWWTSPSAYPEGNQRCLHISAWALPGSTAWRCSCQPLWSDVTGRHSPQFMELRLSLSLDTCKPCSKAGRYLIWESESSRSALHWLPWSEYTTDWFYMWAKLLVVNISWVLHVWTWSSKICMLIVASLPPPPHLLCHNQVPAVWALKIPLQSLWAKITHSVIHKVIHNTRERVVPLKFSFLTRGSGGARKASLHGAVLALGRSSAVSV